MSAKKYTMLLNKKCREVAQVCDGWFCGEIIGHQGGVVCTLFRCQLVTRGENKGHPNFKKSTGKTTVVLTSEDMRKISEEAYG